MIERRRQCEVWHEKINSIQYTLQKIGEWINGNGSTGAKETLGTMKERINILLALDMLIITGLIALFLRGK